ncbi:MAG: biopolymer transporter ExbD [Chitinivibrionales bacterium]|nr:biopolymer transporter ExbD [Chitinivibrionales bacterium]
MAQKRGRGKKVNSEQGLIITSLIDVFTILTIYLLQHFSAEGNLVANAENLSLPNSSSTKRLKDVNLQIAVTNDMIIVDQVPVAPTEDASKIPQEDPDPVIAKLKDNLVQHFQKEEDMVKLGVSNKVEGKLVIQMDKNIPFDVLYKIMNTCAKAGYRAMNFAVMEREAD